MKPLDALLDALALKEVERAGWRERGLQPVESVAAHSWGVAWLVLVLLPAHLDRERALTYALLHDLAEAWVGDQTPATRTADKHDREAAAMRALCERLARPDIYATWQAYERQQDDEARFVRQLDRLDMALQARRYTGRGLDPADFFASAARAIEDPALRALLERLTAP